MINLPFGINYESLEKVIHKIKKNAVKVLIFYINFDKIVKITY